MTIGPTARKSRNTQAGTRRPPVEKGRWASKGTKSLPEQPTINHVLSIVLVHVCQKVLFIQTEVKITLYAIALFCGSLVFDFLPVPRIYLSNRDNLVNLYFVKLGWGWTVLVVGSFIFVTSYTYGCGHKEIVKRHMMRLVIGTMFWFFWSQWFFEHVDLITGTCLGKAILKDKLDCVNNGFQWHSFDISGHAFLLVYINLVLVEEAKAIVGWEGIRDLIRIEEHKRMEVSGNAEQSVLCRLSHEDLFWLKEYYEKWTPYIRSLFLLMTVVSLLSDAMIACTVIYFHTMPQKVAGGAIAIGTWYFTYRFWFKMQASPGLPGSGLFKYQDACERKEVASHRRSSINKDIRQQMFMGMPLNAQKDSRKKETDDAEMTNDKDPLHKYGPKSDFFSQENKTKHYKL